MFLYSTNYLNKMVKKRGDEELNGIKYPQPHSIYIKTENEALDDKIRTYLHVRAKYKAKYQKSKQTKRLL